MGLYSRTRDEFPELFQSGSHLVDQNLLMNKPEKAQGIRSKLSALADFALSSRSDDPEAVPMALSFLFYKLPKPETETRSARSRP